MALRTPCVLGLALSVLLLSVPAHAQDCAEAVTQRDMTRCAELDFQAADADLNASYTSAMAFMRSVDDADPAAGAATQLRTAQRAWIPFRDAACEAEALPYRGGSIQPMVKLFCLERLTRQRTEDLNLLLPE